MILKNFNFPTFNSPRKFANMDPTLAVGKKVEYHDWEKDFKSRS